MKPDWMHAVDEGIAAIICGNVLVELEKLYPSLQKSERVAEMWADIRDLYQKFDVPPANRLPKLSEKDIQMSGKQPELSGKAAHIRGLCPLLGDLASGKLFQTVANSALPSSGCKGRGAAMLPIALLSCISLCTVCMCSCADFFLPRLHFAMLLMLCVALMLCVLEPKT